MCAHHANAVVALCNRRKCEFRACAPVISNASSITEQLVVSFVTTPISLPVQVLSFSRQQRQDTGRLFRLNEDDLVTVTLLDTQNQILSGGLATAQFGATHVRRLNTYGTGSDGSQDRDSIFCVLTLTGTVNADEQDELIIDDAVAKISSIANQVQYTTADVFDTGLGDPGSVAGAASWLLESDVQTVSGNFNDVAGAIPELDIKVDSVAVTAITKKLRAKWSPELGQDLNAYHNLDAEVELTGILSEQVALEIDREILEDLIKRATAGTLHWSRQPGRFVNRETGADLEAASSSTGYPEFTGTVSEWYETLMRPSMMFLLVSTERHFAVALTSSFAPQKLPTYLSSPLVSAHASALTQMVPLVPLTLVQSPRSSTSTSTHTSHATYCSSVVRVLAS